jgi:hypothetical protein
MACTLRVQLQPTVDQWLPVFERRSLHRAAAILPLRRSLRLVHCLVGLVRLPQASSHDEYRTLVLRVGRRVDVALRRERREVRPTPKPAAVAAAVAVAGAVATAAATAVAVAVAAMDSTHTRTAAQNARRPVGCRCPAA